MFQWLNKIRLKGLPTKLDNNILVVDQLGDIGINDNHALYGTYHGHSNIWVSLSDFISDKGDLRYLDGGVVDKTADALLSAHVLIPIGATATDVTVYSNTTSATVNVFEKRPSVATEQSVGSGDTGVQIDITNTAGSIIGTHLLIKIDPNDQDNDRFYGAKITLI
jgi:hypothetical protein